MDVNPLHQTRMVDLVRFTAASLETDYPSPFGCAIYDDDSGVLVAQAYDTVLRNGDPTEHGEMNAIRLATKRLGRLSLAGCTLYSTCEPCPMCMSAAIWAEVDAVIFGASTMEDANRYWPQASDLSPFELAERMRRTPKCRVIAHVAREACQELFERCDQVRQSRKLGLPPHRAG